MAARAPEGVTFDFYEGLAALPPFDPGLDLDPSHDRAPAPVKELRDRIALAFFSATELPLVVAITTIAIDNGEMRATTAASLVGAAVLSTAIYPLIGLRLRGSRAAPEGV